MEVKYLWKFAAVCICGLAPLSQHNSAPARFERPEPALQRSRCSSHMAAATDLCLSLRTEITLIGDLREEKAWLDFEIRPAWVQILAVGVWWFG